MVPCPAFIAVQRDTKAPSSCGVLRVSPSKRELKRVISKVGQAVQCAVVKFWKMT